MIDRKASAELEFANPVARAEALHLRNHVAERIGLLLVDRGDGERIKLVADHELERLVLQARRARVSIILVVNAGLNAMKAGRHILDDVVVQVAQLAKFGEPKDGHGYPPVKTDPIR